MKKIKNNIPKPKESSKKKITGSGIGAKQRGTKKLNSGHMGRKKPVRQARTNKELHVSGIQKQYLELNGSCNVTFRLPKAAAPDAQVVTIAGDFNNWNVTSHKMRRLKNGDFKATLRLHRNKAYRFKYFIDGTRWENDWCADKYVPNSFGTDDSLVIV